eukprot:7371248-Heterocapsa_arctica.AAC.1
MQAKTSWARSKEVDLQVIIDVRRLFGAYSMSVLLRLKISRSGSEFVQHDQRVVRNSVETARTSGFERAPV